jgi:membrane-anchored glycerophosphoryl diester phosphodiesterase (GDPDase)
MSAPEIILIIVCSLFVLFIFGRMIYKRIKGVNDECNSCKSNIKKMMKDVKKELAKL